METYDFIIVGAGSSGCVLADRLSRDPKYSVLLIEAGPPDTSPLVHMPMGFGKLMYDRKYAWQFPIVPSGRRNTPETWCRGKTLGGSSSINGMIYVRGQHEDYDSWEANGATGWGWRSVGAAFKSIEDHELGAAEWRGAGGPLHVGIERHPSEILDVIIAAGVEMGLPRKTDLNDVDQQGIGYLPRTIYKGRRFSAARAFLEPAKKRPNLRIVTNTEVDRVLFEGRRATAVACRGPQGAVTYSAGREIILSSGALHSPKLLQLSGIGPAELLLRLGIEVVQDSPGVGANMREHRCLFMQYRLKRDLGFNRHLRGFGLATSVIRYYLNRSGPMAAPAHQAGAFLRSRPDVEHPDVQLIFGAQSVTMEDDKVIIDQQPGVQIIGCDMRPESQGTITIKSADSRDGVEIIPNFLSDSRDQRVAIDMTHIMRRLFQQKSLAAEIVEEMAPTATVRTDDEIVSYVRENATSGHHAAGTCKMGQDALAVVDPRLRVRGVTGLRVMDCSVMPTVVSGNTNGPVMAMAWCAANLILQDQVL